MTKILYASRAFESPPNEGGFVLLRDLAGRFGSRSGFQTAFLSTCSNEASIPRLIAAYRKPGWSRVNSGRFIAALLRYQHRFDLLHLAHMPTAWNAGVMKRVVAAGRARGVRYVQTVTALPGPASRLHIDRLLWGDYVVCLNDDVKKALDPFHPSIRRIVAIPDPDRVSVAGADISARSVMQPRYRWIVLPFNFRHLPKRFPIAEIICGLLEQDEKAAIVMPYRSGEQRMVSALRESLPRSLQPRIVVVDAQSNGLSYVARSDVMIYPMADAPRKFNPPLIVLEAAGLGVKILASDTVRLPKAFALGAIRLVSTTDVQVWISEANKLLRIPEGVKVPTEDLFASYIEEYSCVYRDCIAQ